MHQLHLQPEGAFLAPPPGKRMLLLIDDIHMSSHGASRGDDLGPNGLPRVRGCSAITEWMRFTLEQRGFYTTDDNTFLSVRDASFLPSLLSPDSQSLQVCKRFSRHFFVVFMESPSEASIEKIFSTVLRMNLLPILPAEPLPLAVPSKRRSRASDAISLDREETINMLLVATLRVCWEADIVAQQRLHGLARIFLDVCHVFALVPTMELASVGHVGHLWAFAMRTAVLDGYLQAEKMHKKRQVYGAMVRGMSASFGLTVGTKGEDGKLDLNSQVAELDGICYAYQADPETGLLQLRRVRAEQAAALLTAAARSGAGADSAPGGQGDAGTGSRGAPPAVHPDTGALKAEAEAAVAASKPGAPAWQGLLACKELLHEDGMASLMWLHDAATTSTILRLCHTMYLHPLVCVVGGWAQLPLLTLASRLFGADDLQVCTQVTAEALERLLGGDPARSDAKEDDLPVEGGPLERMRVLAIDEDDLPRDTPQAFFDGGEYSEYFRRHASLHLSLGAHEQTDTGPDPSTKEGPRQRVVRSRLLVVCRSAASLQALGSRCPHVHYELSATFALPAPGAVLQRVAAGYLPGRLAGVVSLASLPRQRLMLRSTPSSPAQASAQEGGHSAPEHSEFAPLAQAADAVHQRLRGCLGGQYGEDFAGGFCTAYRFAQFLQAVVRLARHGCSARAYALATYSATLAAVARLQQIGDQIDLELRAARVSLRLLVREAGVLSLRVASTQAERLASGDLFAKVEKQLQELKAIMGAVDKKFSSSVARVVAEEATALRRLSKVELPLFDDLGKLRPSPPAVAKTLEVLRSMVVFLEQPGDEEEDDADDLVGLDAPAAPPAARPAHKAGSAAEWKSLLQRIQNLPVDRLLPPPLAAQFEGWAADAACQPQALAEVSLAASGMAGWLVARVHVHRVLEKREEERSAAGNLTQLMQSKSAQAASGRRAHSRAERLYHELIERHTAAVRRREETTKLEAI